MEDEMFLGVLCADVPLQRELAGHDFFDRDLLVPAGAAVPLVTTGLGTSLPPQIAHFAGFDCFPRHGPGNYNGSAFPERRRVGAFRVFLEHAARRKRRRHRVDGVLHR